MNLNPGWKSPKINGTRTYQYSHPFGYRGQVEAKGPKSAVKAIAERHNITVEEAERAFIAAI